MSDHFDVHSSDSCIPPSEYGYDNHRGTCTKFRKMAVSMVCSVMESEKEGLANFMKHSSRLQAKYYDLSQQGIRASRMSNLVTKMVLGQDISESDLKKETKYLEGCEKYVQQASAAAGADVKVSLKVGQHVMALYPPDKRYYPGIISSEEGDMVRVEYDDGYRRRLKKSQIKAACVAPSPEPQFASWTPTSDIQKTYGQKTKDTVAKVP